MAVRRWVNIFCLFVILSTTVPGILLAQSSGGRSSLFGEDEFSQQKRASEILGMGDLDIPLRVPEASVFALDEPIDPATYVLGPGDVIGVNLRGGSGWFFQSMISPDGTLLVPRLPMLHLGGLTLAQAQDTAKVVWGGGSTSQVDIGLLQLRMMRVSVGGAVRNPGEYVVTAADRATTLIALAGGLLDDESSLRRAWLDRRDGTKVRVDLLRFLRSGSKASNPRLMAGDHLIVEERNLAGATVAIGGGVQMPGSYEWAQGDRLMDLVEVAGGLKPEAVVDSVELIRFDNLGPAGTTFLNLDLIRSAGERGPELHAGDLVNVHQVVAKPQSASVTLMGEVNRPGVYPIVEGQTRLVDIIKLAGGFTEFAYLPGGRIYKEIPDWDFRNSEAARIDTLSGIDRDELDLEFLKYYYRTQARDYYSVEMGRLFVEEGSTADSSQNVLLFDGLEINIPRMPKMILVAGQVKHPGYYPYEEGLKFRNYINQAGGYARGAHKSRARLVGYETPLWQHPQGWTRVEAGSMIFVPVKQVGTDWELFRDIVGILLQFGTFYLLAIRTFE